MKCLLYSSNISAPELKTNKKEFVIKPFVHVFVEVRRDSIVEKGMFPQHGPLIVWHHREPVMGSQRLKVRHLRHLVCQLWKNQRENQSKM